MFNFKTENDEKKLTKKKLDACAHSYYSPSFNAKRNIRRKRRKMNEVKSFFLYSFKKSDKLLPRVSNKFPKYKIFTF
jgi:hypothetical protein